MIVKQLFNLLPFILHLLPDQTDEIVGLQGLTPILMRKNKEDFKEYARHILKYVR